MEDYGEMFRAGAFFSFKYGKIDFLESNNEYWLAQDARLRTDFHIVSGKLEEEIAWIRNKSKMKEIYIKNGIEHYITTNVGEYRAVWSNSGLICEIHCVPTREELIRMIDSIYS